MEELFDEFQEEPVASGSVGQVHKARLRAEHALDGPGINGQRASETDGLLDGAPSPFILYVFSVLFLWVDMCNKYK